MGRARTTFTDLTGGVHTVRITMAARRKLREVTEVDLLQAVQDPQVLQTILLRITEEDDFVVQALGVILGTDPEALERNMDATTYSDASTALVEAIIDFFPQSSPLKKPLQAVLENQTAMLGARAELMEEAILQAIRQVITTA